MKTFLQKHSILLRLLSLLLAIVLWIVAMDEENPTKSRWFNSVPVRVSGDGAMLRQSGLSVIEGADNTVVKVRLTGPNKSVTAVTLNQIAATVDVSDLTTPGEYDLPVSVSVSRMGVEFVTCEPAKVHLRVDTIETRTVPIELNVSGTPADGFRAGRPTSKTEEVTIEGPASELSQIKKAVATVNVDGLIANLEEVECAISLCNEAGEQVDSPFIVSKTEKIRVSVIISQINTIPLSVTLKDGGMVKATQASWTVEPKTVQVIADDPSSLANMTSLNLGEIDLGSVRTGVPIEMPINTPEGVRLDTGQPRSARVTISIEGVDTRQVQVTKFVPTDTAGEETSYDVSVETQSVEIELRGSKDALEEVDGSSFSIGLTFDSMSLGEGVHVVKGVVTAIGLPDGVTLVAEDVQVTVKITEKAVAVVPSIARTENTPVVETTESEASA